MILFILILITVFALPFVFEALRKPMSQAQRKAAPGKFAELSLGITHYQWFGPVRGPVAVVIHGLTTPSIGLQEVAQGLGASGYRVLAYDLYGRGFSDAPTMKQTEEFFLTQLDELLADQGLEDDLTLVGYSMGGAIATAFAATEPHRMKRLILLAPAGIEAVESAFSRFCRKTPIIGDWLHGLLASGRMRAAIAKEVTADTPPEVVAAQKAELRRRGFLPSVLSSRRHMLQQSQEQQHRSIDRDGIPVIAIWGESDKVIPLTAMGKMAQWNRTAHHEVLSDAGHAFPYSDSARVVEVLRHMLRTN